MPVKKPNMSFKTHVDIEFSAHDTFLESSSSGTLKSLFVSQITRNKWTYRQDSQNRLTLHIPERG